MVAPLYSWLKNEISPTQGEIALSSPATKFLWINREIFMIEDGVIYKKEEEKKLVLEPKVFQDKIMHLCNNIPMSSHQGTKRTKEKVQEAFFWYGITHSVRNFILTCDVCNKKEKLARYAKEPMILYLSSAPMEKVHLDFLEPLPITRGGNEYVLVMVDQFTKWIECLPLPSQSAELNEMFCRLGFPFKIFTDQGYNFEV